jgi:hypothetical protein
MASKYITEEQRLAKAVKLGGIFKVQLKLIEKQNLFASGSKVLIRESIAKLVAELNSEWYSERYACMLKIAKDLERYIGIEDEISVYLFKVSDLRRGK